MLLSILDSWNSNNKKYLLFVLLSDLLQVIGNTLPTFVLIYFVLISSCDFTKIISDIDNIGYTIKLTNSLKLYDVKKNIFKIIFIYIFIESLITISAYIIWTYDYTVLNIIGYTISDIMILSLEIQVNSVIDVINYLYIITNDKVTKDCSVCFLRQTFGELSDLFERFQALYGPFLVADLLRHVVTLVMNFYFVLSGSFKTIDSIDTILIASSSAFISIAFTIYRISSLVNNCDGPANQVS